MTVTNTAPPMSSVSAQNPATPLSTISIRSGQEPEHTPEMLLTVLKDAAWRASAALSERDQTIVKVRDAGATWRDIAQAVKMTEHGVAKLYARTKGSGPA